MDRRQELEYRVELGQQVELGHQFELEQHVELEQPGPAGNQVEEALRVQQGTYDCDTEGDHNHEVPDDVTGGDHNDNEEAAYNPGSGKNHHVFEQELREAY